MKIVTGFRGENHITSNDDQGRNQGIFGTGSYVLPVRSKFAATLVSANELQIGDGEGVLQGVHFRTEPTSTDSVTIENGSQGMLRTDLVCVRYEKNAETAVESVSWVVYTGTPAASNPVTPSYTEGDILAGDTVAEMPMYKVNLNGITVQSVTAMFETLVSAEGLIELLGDTSIASIGDGTVTGALASLNTDLAKLQYNKTSGRIELNSYTDSNNPYVFPSDGYIWVSSEKLTTGEFQIVVRTANGAAAAPIYVKINAAYEIHSRFVKKGMNTYARTLPSGALFCFVPLNA